MKHSKDSAFAASALRVGQSVVVRPTGKLGTVEAIEPRAPITGQVLVHVSIDECPWELVQPEMSLRKHEAERG